MEFFILHVRVQAEIRKHGSIKSLILQTDLRMCFGSGRAKVDVPLAKTWIVQARLQGSFYPRQRHSQREEWRRGGSHFPWRCSSSPPFVDCYHRYPAKPTYQNNTKLTVEIHIEEVCECEVYAQIHKIGNIIQSIDHCRADCDNGNAFAMYPVFLQNKLNLWLPEHSSRLIVQGNASYQHIY